MRGTEFQMEHSALIAKPWHVLDDFFKPHEGGKSIFHLLWYILIGLIVGLIVSTLGAILILYICFKLNIHFPKT